MLKTEFDTKSLCSDIRKMGIRPGDVVILHASMKSIGLVEGGPQAVIRAFQKAVTPRGAILMPTFSYCMEKIYEPAAAYDRAATPSQTGLVTETFRRMKGVLRSNHPTHSVAAWGQAARELVEGHEQLSGLAAGSPFHRAAERGAKICMIGCGFTSLSLLHVAESLAKLPFMAIFNWWFRGWLPSALLKRGGKVEKIQYPSIPGCSKSFGVAEDLARKKGLIRNCRFGAAHVILADARAILDLVVERLRRQPDFLLCPPGECRGCDERRVVLEPATPAEKFVGGFIIDVVNRAGIRLAGSVGEDKAAEIIAGRMEEIGLANTGVKRFPIKVWRPGYAALSINLNGKWENIPAAPAAYGPATPPAGITGEAVILENAADIVKISQARAEIAVLWGTFGASGDEFRRIMNSPVKAFIFVDSRFGHADLVSAGVPAQWIRHFKKPMVSIPFPDAVRVFGRGPVQCRLTVSGSIGSGSSTVVTGEILSSGPERGVILVSGHHDSTFNSPAPDDNLSGVATALAVAAKLTYMNFKKGRAGLPVLSVVEGPIRPACNAERSTAGRPSELRSGAFGETALPSEADNVARCIAAGPDSLRRRGPFRHTIRFCSFGTEEILSEGARWYAFESGLADDVRFVVNNDAVGARAGCMSVFVAGAPALAKWVGRRIRKTLLQVRVEAIIDPFSDQFPFNARGIPSIWFYRSSMPSGRHFHHTVRDTLAEMSFKVIADLAGFEARLVAELARGGKFPFPLNFPPEAKTKIAKMRRAWLGGVKGLI